MGERVEIHNPHDVPVEVPGYGVLGAGESVTVGRSAALRRALEHGRLATGTAPERTDREDDSDGDSGYAVMSVEDLQVEAESRGLEIEGSGSGGRVVKADLVAALEASDAE